MISLSTVQRLLVISAFAWAIVPRWCGFAFAALGGQGALLIPQGPRQVTEDNLLQKSLRSKLLAQLRRDFSETCGR